MAPRTGAILFCTPILPKGRANLAGVGYNGCMTNISRDDVRHLAQLSSLQLDDSEIDALQTDLGNILGYVEQLAELITECVVQTYQVTDLHNVWRDDSVVDYKVSREQLLELSPESYAHQVKVPKVI